ncbi:MAG TPA: S8 family serine peptidase [Actinocatenispora sp.]
MTDRRQGRALRRVIAGTLSVLAIGFVAVTSARPAAAEERCVDPGHTYQALPWAQMTLEPQRVWPFSTGQGQTVAVVDTGIDGSQPQLSGRVLAGTNVGDGKSAGNKDCAGHGTQVAGVIAAKATSGIGFRGLAPNAKLLPVALTAKNETPDSNVDPKLLAKGINWAVGHGATIVTVPYATYSDDADLKSAVANAHQHNVLVVAATGDLGSENNPDPYPASYPGVLAVGTLAQDGTVSKDSGYGKYVGLVAPGSSVVTTQAGHGMILVDGSAYAAGFASAVAALAWSHRPDLSVDELVHRLEATAAPGGEAAPGQHYGWGIADPYQAIVGRTADGARQALPSAPAKHIDKAAQARAHAWASSTNLALIGTGAGVALALLIIAAMVYLPRGRRRRWRAGRAAGPYDDPEADMPSVPVHLFKEPEADRS